tara:strand:+ start:6477 stop:8666 length:2190 start_codon:yes stop_codon:yes gene_type:complete
LADDLFSHHGDQLRLRQAPLAERLRPTTLEEFAGQGAILAEGRLLRRAIAADRVGNLILHGPPGVGKTTLARIIATHTRAHFSSMNAVLAGVKDLREQVDSAQQRLERHGLQTILFIDEVHRFNSAQQDALLPWVENGTLSLIGATTENPYFEVNKALVSRSRLFRLQSLEANDLRNLLHRALRDKERGYGNRSVTITPDAEAHLVDVANGDARSLLNALELAVESTPPSQPENKIEIDLTIAEESIQERAVLYDKQGDAHFDTISAFIKSLRGSDADASLFWLARMLEAGENPRFIFRRMLISAGEDIGLADPQAVVVVESCAAAFERIGLPEGFYSLAQAALYLACAEKSNSTMGLFEAIHRVRSTQNQNVPSHLRDAHRDSEAFGDGKGYRYPHAYREHWVAQQYLPDALQGEVFWTPSKNGWEGQRQARMIERRAAQLAVSDEAAHDHPLLISSGPDLPDMDRWLHRQLLQNDERLLGLQQRLWSGVNFQRTDRVLVLGGRSLLWALGPLNAVQDGGVTILCSSDQEKTRLQAQVDLLDPLHRPKLLIGGGEALKELPQGWQFEVVGGRLNRDDRNLFKSPELWHQLQLKLLPGSQLNFLLSHTKLGPAALLIEQCKISSGGLTELIEMEQQWLQAQQLDRLVLQQLEGFATPVRREFWEESLSLQVDEHLQERWLGEDRPYRLLINHCHQPETVFSKVKQLLKREWGAKLPQQMIHQTISCTKT